MEHHKEKNFKNTILKNLRRETIRPVAIKHKLHDGPILRDYMLLACSKQRSFVMKRTFVALAPRPWISFRSIDCNILAVLRAGGSSPPYCRWIRDWALYLSEIRFAGDSMTNYNWRNVIMLFPWFQQQWLRYHLPPCVLPLIIPAQLKLVPYQCCYFDCF